MEARNPLTFRAELPAFENFPIDFELPEIVQMGGFGSGRLARKAKTSSLLDVDLARIKKGKMGAGCLTWSYGGRRVGSIDYYHGDTFVRLTYRARHGDQRIDVDQSIRLTETPTQFGGRRSWFMCPLCSQRCRIVFIAPHGPACRKCCNLAYPSQSEPGHSRDLSRAQAIRQRLGGSANMLDDFPDKPKGMHWNTYDGLRELHDRLEGSSLMGIVEKFGLRLQGRS